MGKRDVGFDVTLHVLEQWYRPGLHAAPQPAGTLGSVVALNDQHAYVRVPRADPLAVGEMLGCGISHPCTAFDKWRLIPVVDDEYTVVDAIATFF